MLPRALIVEDDRPTREALRAIVAGEGFFVDAVDSGERALEMIENHRYAMVLLDIVLPKMSGADVMEHLHNHKPRVLESVVVVSGLDVTEIRKAYPAVHEALGKPVMPARLRKAIRHFLPADGDAGASMSGISVA